jgi:hypothetical protein
VRQALRVLVVCASASLTPPALAQPAPPPPPPAPVARPIGSIAVPPVQGTVGIDDGARLTQAVRQQVARAGYALVPTDRVELAGADAVLETMVVADGQGCTVRASLRAGTSVAPSESSATCSNDPSQTSEQQIGDALSRAVSGSLATAQSSGAPIAVEPPPAPPPPPAPLPPPPPPKTPGDAYVFETGIDLETRSFAGLGHIVAGTDETKTFRGAFALTVVRNDIHDFSGGLAFAFGKNDVHRFRGGLSMGLLTNEADDVAGFAQIGLRKSEARSRFTGVAQVSVGWNDARRFAGVSQLALVNISREFTGVAQVGLGNVAHHGFAGGAQIGVVNYGGHELAGAGQFGVVNVHVDGTQRALVQAALIGNVVERETQSGLQIAPFDLFGRFKGGAQIGFVNLLGTKSPGDYFDRKGGRRRADFAGGLELGFLNAAYGNVEGGAQIGVFNVDKSSFLGMMQVGALTNVVDGDVEAATQIGAVNIVHERFAGFAQIGGANTSHAMDGVQVGIANFAGEAHGVQIGVFNRASSLKGVQIGLLNVIADRETLPVLPIANLGL